MSSDEALVNRDAILAYMLCNICDEPYQKATTINECLHTFVGVAYSSLACSLDDIVCRKCIYRKLQDEGMKACPKCNVDLGVAPLAKLRPNNKLQELMAELFPHEHKKKNKNDGEVKAVLEAAPSASVPTKKEVRTRSLASLTNSLPRVTTTVEGRGQSSKAVARRTGRDLNSNVDGPFAESSLEIRSKDGFQTSKGPTGASQSSILVPTGPSLELRGSSFKNYNRHDALKSFSPVATGLHVKPTLDKGKGKMPQTSSMQQGDAAKSLDCREEVVKKPKAIEIVFISDSDESTPPKPMSPKKKRRVHRKSKHFSDIKMPTPPLTVVNGSTSQPENSIVFRLFAAYEKEEGGRPLPQIPPTNLNFQDAHAPISSIHTYLKERLELQSEDELDIWCGRTRLDPKLPLNRAQEGWLQTVRVSVTIGSSAEDFMMPLHYAWRRD